MPAKPTAAEIAHIAPPLRHLAVPVESLVPDPQNTRRHSEENIAVIAESLSRFGQDQVLVYQKNTGVVLKGNGRFEAATRLGWRYVAAVPVDDEGMRAAARAVADNRASELAVWEPRVLARVLGALPEAELTAAMRETLAALAVDQSLPAPFSGQSDAVVRSDEDSETNFVPGVRPEELDATRDLRPRRVVLMCSVSQYGPLMDRVDAVRVQLGVDTVSAAVLELLRRYCAA